MIVKLLTEHHLEFLSLTGDCPGSSESTLVKMANCWKSHDTAQIRVCDRKYAKCHTKADAHVKMGFQYISISVYIVRTHARIQRGPGGPDPPP